MKPRGQAQINFTSAIWGLFYFLPGRIPYRTWGFGLLGLFFYLLLTGWVGGSPSVFYSVANQIKTFGLPTLTQTIHSPAAKEIGEEKILESIGLVKTPKGTLPFTRKLKVLATSYDKNCSGCNEITASGLPAGYGVVAVDPKVIPLGSKLFIPGYGLAVAGDTGGTIKGNKIDLGFDDVKHSRWSSRFVEIYILK